MKNIIANNSEENKRPRKEVIVAYFAVASYTHFIGTEADQETLQSVNLPLDRNTK